MTSSVAVKTPTIRVFDNRGLLDWNRVVLCH